jgi:imidazole glycerol-phosphate synthase subunit HisF
MLSVRVIPSLLLKGQGFVKGKKFKDHRYIGDPVNTIRIFNEKQADEIAVLDINASRNGLEPNFKLLKQLATEAFMPLSYGGGVRSLAHIEQLFTIGFEKIVLNTIAFENPKFIKDAVSIAGSSSVVISIDVRKNFFSKYEMFTHSGTKKQSANVFDFAKHAQDLGAGEFIICNIDKEGLRGGYDLDLLRKMTSILSVPVIASGGACTFNDFKQAVKESRVSAVSAGSLFVYHGKHDAVLIQYPDYQTLSNIFS